MGEAADQRKPPARGSQAASFAAAFSGIVAAYEQAASSRQMRIEELQEAGEVA